MKKSFVKVLALAALGASALMGCAGEKTTLTMVWYPNESAADLASAREEFGRLITQATGKQVEQKLTTDYTIAIEALVSGNADIGFFGPQGYVEANKKNPQIQPLFVNSGASGTLNDAVYFSWLIVKPENEAPYKNGDQWIIDPIQGKKFSFVSTSSTSGFKVPSSGIVSYFGKMDTWKGLKAEDLLEGGSGKFFSEVLFGGSHQGSGVNVLSGVADVGAVCDTCVSNYVELAEGEENRPGALYKVRTDAADPFTTYVGQTFRVISVTPVVNSPFVANTATLPAKDAEALKVLFTSAEVAANTKIFVPKGSTEFKGMFTKSKNETFLPVEDSFFEPVRALSQ